MSTEYFVYDVTGEMLDAICSHEELVGALMAHNVRRTTEFGQDKYLLTERGAALLAESV